MEDWSEENIRKNCPHCNLDSPVFDHTLAHSGNFHIVCDAHDLKEGHVLIMPKAHISCTGEYSPELFQEFMQLYNKVSRFVQEQYGAVATFEHGIFGQSVFHSHVHILPFTGGPEKIIPEGKGNLVSLRDLQEIPQIFKRDGGYLFFSIGDELWTVNPVLVAPRFFRDRFANALGVPGRGDWKAARQNPELLKMFGQENDAVEAKWNLFVDKD